MPAKALRFSDESEVALDEVVVKASLKKSDGFKQGFIRAKLSLFEVRLDERVEISNGVREVVEGLNASPCKVGKFFRSEALLVILLLKALNIDREIDDGFVPLMRDGKENLP